MNKKISTLIKSLLIIFLVIIATSGYAQDADQKYQQAITSADAYFKAGDYLNAKASYQVASQAKPDEQYPKDRMQESISLLRKQMEEMAVYQEKLAYADQLYGQRSYDNAIKAYEEAQKLMPSETYPAEQIDKIKVSITTEAQNRARYTEFIQTGDALFTEGDFQGARTKFENASNIYPELQEPKDKIAATDNKLAEIAAQQSGYQKAISEAEMFHARKDYEKELASYQLAVELQPEEPLPQVKIRELNEFLRKYQSYNNFVAEGDELYITKRYADAKVKYELALGVLPNETYPKEIISKINVALSEKTEKDKVAYDEAVAMADQLYSQEDYDAAMVAYSDALRFWPDGDHAKQRLGSISEIMALRRAQEEAYLNTITLADKMFANGQYTEAKAEYINAAAINPFEQYPKVRLAEIDMILAEISDKLEQYDKVVNGADKLFNAGDYSESRIQYLKAQDIFSDRSYPADQIRMIDDILNRESSTREAYLAALARADAHFAAREWEAAKVDYVDASDLIPVEKYPKDKITEINNILAMLKAEQDNYLLALKTADQLYADKDFAAAILEYRKAANIFQEEKYPQEKIDEINGILATQLAQEELENNYLASIGKADQLFSDAGYAAAKAEYEKALALKPGEAYPTGKINEINGILAEQAHLNEIDAAYQAAIAKADGLLAVLNYKEARTAYLEANTIKESETYPEEKIAEIDAALASVAEQKALLESQYATAIAEGDALFGAADYSEAKVKYTAALALKPGEAYPTGKIAEIEGLLMGLEQQRILNENYAAAITLADAHFADAAYTQAKAEYEKAAGLKPAEQYPKDKIAEITGILAEQARLLGIDENYATAINAADGFFNNKQYNEAKASYTQATALKPDEAYPKDRITEINGILADLARLQSIDDAYNQAIASADAFFASAGYGEAREAYVQATEIKSNEQYPKDKIAEIDALLAEQARLAELNKDYAIAITTADGHFAVKQYEEALEAYKRAQGIKADEAYPGQKIEEINGILTNMEQQRLTDEGYANAIALGDNFFTNKEYAEARSEYEKALGFKANEAYPKQKITEINGLLGELARLQQIEDAYNAAILSANNFFDAKEYAQAKSAYQQALIAKAGDTYASGRVAEIDEILAEQARLQDIETRYGAAISSGDAAFASSNYQTARDAYVIALELKAGEEHPTTRIAEIDRLLIEQASLLATQQAYDEAIKSADALFALKDYTAARSGYEAAMQIKADESYPEEKVAEIDALLSEIAKQTALDNNYTKAIGEADDYLDRGNYIEALNSYKAASEIKPNELYPKDKITEINGKLSEMEAERQIAYDAAIAQADSYFDAGNYRSAKASYETATTIKPNEKYARDRLDEVTRLYMAELETLKIDYRKYIADADNYFNEKIYDGAIENYRIASSILPDEEYPERMISRITKIINDNAITDVNKLAQIIPNNTTKEFPFEVLPVNVRKDNYILIKVKNLSDHDFKMLVSFGQDGSKTGGVVLQVPEGPSTRDYIVRIGALYKWFSEDNNWLSIYPEGGDIEVGLVRISKSD